MADKKKILIVDNDLSMAEKEKNHLKFGNYDVTVETDGESAAQKALSGTYDILILEMEFSGWDGVEVCRKYRENYQAPVIFLTGRDSDEEQLRGLEAGADDYLIKPLKSELLMARIWTHLNRYEVLSGNRPRFSSSEKEEVIIVRDLKIDRGNQRVFVRGEEKELGAKEFELLWYLASHPGELCLHQDIVKGVWGHSMTALTALRTTKHNLVKKLGVEEEEPLYIETVKNRGYRFCSNL